MDITEQLTHESRIALAAAAEITRLRAEVEALRADADRWRWISSQGWCPFSEADDAWDSPAALTVAVDEHIAMDAARAAQGGG